MHSTTTATSSPSLAAQPLARLSHAVAAFLIRRRILLSGILFGVLLAQDVAYGPKPHDVTNFRDPLSVLGVSLVVVGVALRSWSAGILRKNAELTVTGPYGLVRNPLYVGSFLMMFGFCTLIADPMNFLFILGPILVIYIVKVRQEEQLLAERFADQWTVYSKTVPRFFPGLRIPNVRSEWSLSQWLGHREYQAVLASLMALVAFKVWHHL